MNLPYPRSQKPFTLDPNSYAEDLEFFQGIAKEIGFLAYAWNSLQQSYLMLFIAMMGADQATTHTDIWNSFRSDARQRDLILAAAPTALENHPLKKDVIAIVNEGNKIAAIRNDAIHSPFVLAGMLKFPMPETATGHPGARRLAMRTNIEKELREATNYSIALAEYAKLLGRHISSPVGRPPLPRKPIRPPTLIEETQKRKTPRQPRKDN